jgi:hypothetical protein
MSTEQLIIELDARTAKLDAKLSKVERQLDGVDESTKKVDGSLSKLGNVAGIAGAAILKVGAAALALGTAIGVMTLKAASSRKELELFSRQANTTASDFMSLAFATKQYGINAEQIADISKDISDKVGEFAAAGTGTFQDYADVMKLTKEEARSTAIEFQSLSSEQVIGKMVSEMESANVTGSQMIFVLESMGNDLSKLAPLFSNNSKELNTLKARFDSVNASMNITAGQAEGLKEVAVSFDLVQASLGKSATAISATLAPVIDDFFNDVIAIVPDATQTIIDFANSFLDAENITSKAGVMKELEASQERVALLTEKQENSIGRMNKSHTMALNLEQEKLESLEAQLVVLSEQEKIAEARRLQGGEIGGESGLNIGDGSSSGLGTGDEIQAIEDRFKTEELLLSEKLVRELIIIGENNETKINLEKEFAEKIQSIRDKAENEKLKVDKRTSDELDSADKDTTDKKLNRQDSAINAGMALNTLLFDDNKAIAAGLIVADTATAIMRSLSIAPYDYFNVGIIAATGAAQLANALSSSKGGGSSSGASGGGSSTPATPEDFTPETSSLEFSDATSSGSASFNLTVPDGDEIGQAIANWLSKAQNEGRA